MAAGTANSEVHVQAPAPGEVAAVSDTAEHQAERRRHRRRSRRRCRTPLARSCGVGEGDGQQRPAPAGASSAPKAPWSGTRSRRGRRSSGRAPPSAERDRAKPTRPAMKRPLAAEEVAERAAEQQEAAEGERVGGDDPLPVVGREVQRLLGRRNRDRHDRRVQHDHQLRDAEQRKDRPPIRFAPRRVRRRRESPTPIAAGPDRLSHPLKVTPRRRGGPALRPSALGARRGAAATRRSGKK